MTITSLLGWLLGKIKHKSCFQPSPSFKSNRECTQKLNKTTVAIKLKFVSTLLTTKSLHQCQNTGVCRKELSLILDSRLSLPEYFRSGLHGMCTSATPARGYQKARTETAFCTPASVSQVSEYYDS